MRRLEPQQSADYKRRPWRCGGQVGRTLYVDHGEGEKDPALLFGMVDTPELAVHIVKIHNWWLDMGTEGERLWGQWKEGHNDDEEGA